MQIVFLGTGTSHGIPMIGCPCTVCSSADPKDNRLRSALFVKKDKYNLVIDCGPDFRQQILTYGTWDINAVLLTHEHNDHVAGLDDLRPIHYAQKRNFPIYLNERTAISIKNRFNYAFDNHHPGVPKFDLNIIQAGDTFNIGSLHIEALEVDHGFIDVLGYKIDDFVYITDAKYLPDATMERIKACSVLVINALRIDKHNTHLNLDQALDIIDQVAPRRAYITHISHQLGLHHQVSRLLPKHIDLAYDGLSIQV